MNQRQIGMRRLLLLALLAGCATGHATLLDNTPRPAVAADSVRIFTSRANIPGPYDEIAIVEADGSSQNSTEALIRKMREEAGKVGANAIVLDLGAGEARHLRPAEKVTRGVAIYIKGGG